MSFIFANEQAMKVIEACFINYRKIIKRLKADRREIKITVR